MFARLQPFLPTAAIFFLIFYFAFHALTGDRGLLSISQRNADLAARPGDFQLSIFCRWPELPVVSESLGLRGRTGKILS